MSALRRTRLVTSFVAVIAGAAFVAGCVPKPAPKVLSATTITSSKNPKFPFQVVTYTAHVTDPAHPGMVPTGTVTFVFNGSPLATRTLTNGRAQFTSGEGTDNLIDNWDANYGGSAHYLPSTNSLIETTKLFPTSVTISPGSVTFGHRFTITVHSCVTQLALCPIGTIDLLDGNKTVPVSDLANGVAHTGVLAIGTHHLDATYVQDSESAFDPSETTRTVTVTPVS